MPEYDPDRPWPGASSWADATTRGALQSLADQAVHMVGFRYAVVNVLHHDNFRAVAVSGEADRLFELMDATTPRTELEEEVGTAHRWGERLLFNPAELRDPEQGWGVTPTFEKTDDPDAWDPEDFLFALLRDEAGQVIGYLSLDVPLTMRRPGAPVMEGLDEFVAGVEASLRLALECEALKAHDLHRTAMLAHLAHEISTPLTAVRGHAELLATHEVEVERATDAILRNVDRLSAALEGLLTLSHTISDPQRPYSSVSLRDTIYGVADVLAHDRAASPWRLAELPGPSDDVLVADRQGNLAVVVRNLLQNAEKYGTPGGCTWVTWELDERSVSVSVRDDGVGIPPEDVPRVFQEFFRSAGSHRGAGPRPPGLGLGLAIVEKCVQSMGGEVSVVSTLGEGSTFTFTWPRSPASVSEAERHAPAHS